MQPGLSRAIPMGILGFIVGVALVMLIRSLQSLQPAMEPQLAMILGTFMSAGFFVWGIGAFDPRMNVHAHEPGEHDDEHALALADAHAEVERPGEILGGYVWLVTTLLLAVILAIAVVAFLPNGLTLQTVPEGPGNTASIGFYEMELFGQLVQFSGLTALLVFAIVMLASLAAIAGVMGMMVYRLSAGVTEVAAVQQTALPPAPLETRTSTAGRIGFLVLFLVVFLALFALFYYVLIGIILGPTPLNLMLSIPQALLLAILILRPRAVARAVGRGARWLANALRRLPNALQ